MSYLELFRSIVSRRMQQGVLRSVFEGCAAAHDISWSQYSGRALRDSIPGLRRLEVEKRLKDMILDPGYDATFEPSTSVTWLRIEGPGIVLTAVTRDQNRDWIEPRRYRETLAEASQQVLPFLGRTDLAEQVANATKRRKLYALLVYGGDLSKRYPTLAHFAFPTPEGDLLPERLRLLQEFPDVVEQYAPQPTRNEPAVTLKKKRKKGDVA